MSNWYEVLEVSEKASKEVIDKAYHVLAKKYHPDLQQGEKKKIAEEKMKKINEAYDVLGNEVKRKEYDEQLKIQREEQERIEEIKNINRQKDIRNSVYNKINELEKIKREELKKQENRNREILQNEIKRVYGDYWKSRGYRIKEPWTLKRFIELLKVFGIIAIIILAIWLFPPTHKLIIDFYEGNVIIKSLVDIIGRIFQGIGLAIVQFFQDTF